MLVTPPGGGPDEASHLVRAGGVARGHFGSDGGETFVALPDRYLLPDVTCWAFQPTVPAACATPRPTSGATIDIPTRAGDYPVWSHLWSGLASRFPGDQQLWWARTANAVLATLLVAGALAAVAGRRLVAASVLCALTPMAWFTFGIVNPSSMAIAGALAFWVGLVHRPDARWLAAAGWAAMALPRRDGLIWASLALAIVLAATDRRLVEWWRGARAWSAARRRRIDAGHGGLGRHEPYRHRVGHRRLTARGHRRRPHPSLVARRRRDPSAARHDPVVGRPRSDRGVGRRAAGATGRLGRRTGRTRHRPDRRQPRRGDRRVGVARHHLAMARRGGLGGRDRSARRCRARRAAPATRSSQPSCWRCRSSRRGCSSCSRATPAARTGRGATPSRCWSASPSPSVRLCCGPTSNEPSPASS